MTPVHCDNDAYYVGVPVLHNTLARAWNSGTTSAQQGEAMGRCPADPGNTSHQVRITSLHTHLSHACVQSRRSASALDEFVSLLSSFRASRLTVSTCRRHFQVDCAPCDQQERCSSLLDPSILRDGLQCEARGKLQCPCHRCLMKSLP